jgi:hypothetical protein
MRTSAGTPGVRCGICAQLLPIDADTGVRFILKNPVECTRCGAPRASVQTSEFEPEFLVDSAAEYRWAGRITNREC